MRTGDLVIFKPSKCIEYPYLRKFIMVVFDIDKEGGTFCRVLKNPFFFLKHKTENKIRRYNHPLLINCRIPIEQDSLCGAEFYIQAESLKPAPGQGA